MPQLKTYRKVTSMKPKQQSPKAAQVILPNRSKSIRHANSTLRENQNNPSSKLNMKAEGILDKFRKRVLGAAQKDDTEHEKDSQNDSDQLSRSVDNVEKIVSEN
mmetsp:Transcript_1862/g.2638  ORF Transcript_1862/g.2638 Transcript_1862/m.2638 type:complete len:104 (-) Transcript_1862:75-386(-)